jgi:hypothetical protein
MRTVEEKTHFAKDRGCSGACSSLAVWRRVVAPHLLLDAAACEEATHTALHETYEAECDRRLQGIANGLENVRRRID